MSEATGSSALAVTPVEPVNSSLEANVGVLMRRATDVAGVCREIVMKTASTIQGRKYVRVEGWQAIAVAYGCVASARDVANIYGPDGKLLGVKAIGEVRRMSDGVAISTAEGFVGVDEPTWFGGRQNGKDLPPRAMFAVRAMAQTRSESRACRGAFSFVVTLIDSNLATTPAEEMEGVIFEPGSTTPPAPAKSLGEKLGAPPRPSPQSGAAAAQHADQPPAHTDADFRPDSRETRDAKAEEARNLGAATHDRSMSFMFGRDKNKPLSELDESSLKWFEGKLLGDLDDASKSRWHDKTRQQLTTLRCELAYRGL